MERKALFTPYTLCPSDLSQPLLFYGVKELGYLFFLLGSRVTNPQAYKIVGFKSQFSSYYFRMIIADLGTLIL